MANDFWKGKRVCVTGGLSFIGSHLSEALVKLGASVRIADNLSSGKRENVEHLLRTGQATLLEYDLRDRDCAMDVVAGRQVVFHLAADHGGRGYVETHNADCAGNLALDGTVFRACRERKVEKIVFASSGCVYPNSIQGDPTKELYLTEDMVSPPYNPDGMYGWAKLSGELTLKAMHRDWGMKSVSLRYFTVIGPRMKEDHAVCAMIARAYTKQNPFEVWGSGSQIRNWTFVSDIVEGTILAAEKVGDASAINLGTMERIRVLDAAKMACALFDHTPEFKFLPHMPTGPVNRVADNALAKKLLGWVPQVPFAEGLERTGEWYIESHTKEEVAERLKRSLTEK